MSDRVPLNAHFHRYQWSSWQELSVGIIRTIHDHFINVILAWRSVAASCFPCSSGLGSSFDVDLVKDVGKALAYECIQKGESCTRPPFTVQFMISVSRCPHPSGTDGEHSTIATRRQRL